MYLKVWKAVSVLRKEKKIYIYFCIHIQTSSKGKQNLFHVFFCNIPYAQIVLFLDKCIVSEKQIEIIAVSL